MVWWITAIVLVLVLLAWVAAHLVTVAEYERGLRYRAGRFVDEVGAGVYWCGPFGQMRRIDGRLRHVTLPGQEVLSADGITLKVSVAAAYRVANAPLAVNQVVDFEGALYLEVQTALREVVGALPIDELLAGRDAASVRLHAVAAARTASLGLCLEQATLKDLMFTGKLRELFAQEVAARKAGLAALEQARGETAALRHLANAARVLADNPSLMQLRAVQAVGGSTGNTLVLGLPAAAVPLVEAPG